MKRIFTLLLVLASLGTLAQQYPVSSISITLPPQPRPNTGDWPMPFVISAQARLVNGQVAGNLIESRILVTIKKDGVKFCSGFTPQNAPLSAFNAPVKTWSGGTAFALLGNNCFMPPGNYELCVQFFGQGAVAGQNVALSNEVCKSFTIAETNSGGTNYTPPQNIMPFDGKSFSAQEGSLPIQFRWTPVSPKPKGDILYTIRLYEIMPGQSKIQALGNAPIEEKEVRNETQTTFRLGKRNNGIVWVVEAVSAERIPGGSAPKNYGKSEATQFSIGVEDKGVSYNPPVNMTPVDGKIFTNEEANLPIILRWTPVLPKPKADVLYKVKIYEVPKGSSKAQAVSSGSPAEALEIKNQTQAPLRLAKRCHDCFYAWNVEASKRSQLGDIEMLGTSEATAFSFSAAKGQDTTGKDHVISLLQPADGTVITPSNARKPTGFVFSVNPVPAPAEGLLYVVKVWEVPPGKTTAQVIQSGEKPVVEKNRGAMCCVGQDLLLPPNSEGKHFAWTVEEVKENPAAGQEVKQGKLLFNEFSVGKGTKGQGGPAPGTMRSQCDVDSKLETYKCLGKDANGNLLYSVTTNFMVNSSTSGAVTHFNDPVNTASPYCNTYGPANIAKGNPSFIEINGTGMNNVTINNNMDGTTGPFKATYSNGSYATTYKITIPAGTTQIIVGYYFYITPDQATCVPRDTINIDAPCPCDLCETLNWGESGGLASLGQDKNTAQISQGFSIPGLKIKQVTAEIIGFDWQVNEDCKKCLKETYGYFTGGTASGEQVPNTDASFPVVDGTPLLNGFELDWNLCGNKKPQPLNGTFKMDVALPPATSLSCCTDQFNICIRYTVVTDDCRTCSKVICYPLSRKHEGEK